MAEITRHVPRIQRREAQLYAGLPRTVTDGDFESAIDNGWPTMFTWLATHGLTIIKPPFIRYYAMTADSVRIELGVPIETAVDGSGDVCVMEVPAGDYVTMMHVGPYDGLRESHAQLQAWAKANDVPLARSDTSRGEEWVAFLETYVTNPAAETDSSKWQVELAYLTLPD